MGFQNEFDSTQIAVLSLIFSFIAADDRSAVDLTVMGAFLTTMGDILSLMAAQKERNSG